MRGVLLVATVAACGRVGFDASRDGATGDGATGDTPVDMAIDVVLANHDEDGDGLDDAIDPCPHLAGSNADKDGDGVGDECDPSGDPHRIALFDTMASALTDATIMFQGPWSQEDDHVELGGTTFSSINRTFAIGDADIWMGVTVLSQETPGDHQLIIHASNGNEQPRYYGQLYRTMTINDQGIVSYDDVSFTYVDSTPLGAGGIPLGEITLHLRMRLDDDAKWVTTWEGEGYETTGPTPAYTGSPRVRFAVGAMSVAVRYTCIIVPN